MKIFSSPHLIVPRTVRWIALSFVAVLLLQSLYRLIFWFYFHPTAMAWGDTLHAFFIGVRFDLRYAALFTLPWWIFVVLRFTDVFAGAKPWRLWLWSITGTLLALILIYTYINDMGYYAYLENRLQADILNYLDNWHESWGVLKDHYPIKTIIFALIASTVLFNFGFYKWLKKAAAGPVTPTPMKQKIVWAFAVPLILFFCIYGQVGSYSLRWSDAYVLKNPFSIQLALHPMQSFVDSLEYRKKNDDHKEAWQAAQDLQPWLGTSSPGSESSPNFARTITPIPRKKPLNVVVVVMESFAAYRSSLTGNALDPTPFLKDLSDKSIYFDRAFTAHVGTDRGVFSLLTGIPDVEWMVASSRNPRTAHQNLIINAFDGYEKMYFLGGDASWANIRGILKSNIKDLQLFEQGSYRAKPLNVWGIDDVNLLQEGSEKLSELYHRGQPFFAIFQTAFNHRPYVINPDHLQSGQFSLHHFSQKELENAGFKTLAEFNSVAYLDFAVKRFMESAKEKGYDKDTLFVFMGDHGIVGVPGSNMPAAFASAKLRLTAGHTPLFFYAPGNLTPRVIHTPAMQVDVMTTIASLCGIRHVNTTLGRDLFDRKAAPPRLAFTFNSGSASADIGVITDDFYFRMWGDGTHGELYDILGKTPDKDVSAAHADKVSQLRALTWDLYHASHYLLTHNAPVDHKR